MQAKDLSIHTVVQKIKSLSEFNALELFDDWDADLCAIGFKASEKAVYISTYRKVISDSKQGYDYDFESRRGIEEEYEVVASHKDRTIEELLQDLKTFFEI